MKLKRILSLILALTMLISVFTVSFSVEANNPLPFTDVKAGDWYYDAVESVFASGIMTGKSETTFDPQANMSRAEFVTVLSRIAAVNAANVGYSDSLDFTDTDPSAWYADAAGWAVDAGLTNGTSATTFSPTRQITRQEMAVLIVRFVKYLGEDVPENAKVDKFADSDKIADWAKADIETMRKFGLIQGDASGNFNPLGNADRASVATIVMRLMPSITTTHIVENGKSDYVIVARENGVDAAERVQYQIEYSTGVKLDIVESSKSSNAIVLGNTGIKTDGMKNDSYEIKLDGKKLLIDANTSEGIYLGAVNFLTAHTFGSEVKFTNCAAETYQWTPTIEKLTINGNDISKYSILYPKNASANTMIGVNDLCEYIEKACGVKLPIKEGAAGDYSIIVEEKNVAVDGAFNNNVENYSVKNSGNNIIITGDAARGAMYGCYDFLEDVLGWIFISESEDYLERTDALDISGVNYTESPGFEYREIYWATYLSSQDMCNKHKIWYKDWVDGIHWIHTFEQLTNGAYPTMTSQPCLTDPEIFDTVLENVLKLLAADPSAELFSVSQNDNYNVCECENCLASDAKYGAKAGTLLAFVNRIAEEVEKEYPNVLIHTLSYAYSVDAPVGIKPRDNVLIQVCAIQNCYNHPLDSTSAECLVNGTEWKFAEDLKDWSKITDKIYVWDYTTNFSHGQAPLPNIRYEVLAGNMKLYADNNVTGIFTQGNFSAGNNGEFGDLRSYLIAKLLWNPYMTEDEYNAHIDKFLRAFYGNAAEGIADAIELWLSCDTSHACCYDDPEGKKLYFKKTIDDLLLYFDNSELLTTSKWQFENTDCSQLQFDLIKAALDFPLLNKSDNEDDKAAAQELCRIYQDKMQKYQVVYSSTCRLTPNFDVFPDIPSNFRSNWDFDTHPQYWIDIIDGPNEFTEHR